MMELFFLLLFVFVDVLGFSIVLPLFPYLTAVVKMDPLEVGLLQSSNALAQLIAVPFIGALSDKYGRRPLLITCVVGTLISFIMLGLSMSFWPSKILLFASRILDGLLGGNISLAQTYIADTTSESDRTRAMGLIGAAFGLGFIVGPAIGGTLAIWNASWPSYFAALLTFFNLIGVILFLKESHPLQKRTRTLRESPSLITLEAIRQCLVQRRLAMALTIRFLYGVVFTIFEMTFGFYTKHKLGVDARTGSYLLSLYAIAFASVQAGGIKSLVRKFDETALLGRVLCLLGITYAVSGFTQTVLQHGLVLIPLGVFSGIANALLSSLVSKVVDPALRGGQLGISAALGASTRVVAPIAGGFLVQSASATPAIACASLCSLLVYLTSCFNKINTNIRHKTI